MKKISITGTACALILFILCFQPLTSVSGDNNDNSMSESVPTGIKTYSMPAEKTKQWESLQNLARKDYDVCQEHCGYTQSCLDRCETAYKNRLANQYKMLLDKDDSTSKK